MIFILFSWAVLTSVCAFGFCLLWRVEVAIRLKRPALMARDDVEASLRAARELSDNEIHALAEKLTLPATSIPRRRPAWEARQCSLSHCKETAVVRWVDSAGYVWYDCSLHWEYERKRYGVKIFEPRH